jgi:hypothetical protein
MGTQINQVLEVNDYFHPKIQFLKIGRKNVQIKENRIFNLAHKENRKGSFPPQDLVEGYSKHPSIVSLKSGKTEQPIWTAQ